MNRLEVILLVLPVVLLVLESTCSTSLDHFIGALRKLNFPRLTKGRNQSVLVGVLSNHSGLWNVLQLLCCLEMYANPTVDVRALDVVRILATVLQAGFVLDLLRVLKIVRAVHTVFWSCVFP